MTGRKIAWQHLKYHWELYLFILPTLVLIGLFQYYPASSGIYHSFYRWNGADISEFVGLKNYKTLLTNTDFWRSFELAFTLGVWNLAKMVPALMVALCIHRCRSERLQFFYRALFVVPMVVPGLVVVLIWRSFFFDATTGFLNKFLFATGTFDWLVWLDKALHWGGIFVQGQSPAWLGHPQLIVASCILWGFPWVGSFAVLMYLAKLSSISKDVYEAGEVDGVSWWSKFTAIEFPLIMGSVRLLVVFAIIETIKDAGMILALAGMDGGPGGNATVPALFMLRKAFIDQDMGFACAIGIVLTLALLGLQKMSNFLTDWNEMSTRTRNTARAVFFVVGCAILATGRFRAVGIGFALLGFPFGEIKYGWDWVMDKLSRGDSSVEPHLRVWPRGLAQAGNVALGVCKHGIVWGVLLVAFLPMYLMLAVSFKNNQEFYLAPTSLPTVLHWENWRHAYEQVTPCLANSIFVSIAATVATLFVALCAAYFFARYRLPLSGIMWNAILILMMMPAIANLIPLFRLLKDMNLLNTLTALIIVGASGAQVFAIFVLRSFVEDIPHDLFEAAEIDGANHFQQMWIIVLPLAGPVLGTVGVMTFIGQWNDFVMPLIIIRDHLRLPVMVELLRMNGEYIKFWGPLMAGYAMASLPVIILFIFSMRLFTKGLTEGAVKG